MLPDGQPERGTDRAASISGAASIADAADRRSAGTGSPEWMPSHA